MRAFGAFVAVATALRPVAPRLPGVPPAVRLLAMAPTIAGWILAPEAVVGQSDSTAVQEAEAAPPSLAQIEIDRRVASARAAAADFHLGTFHYLCEIPDSPGSAAPPAPAGMPDWFTPPAQVFDNVYFVGTRSLNAWAVDTSEGIVLIDPLYNRNVELAVIDGLQELGLDPADITHVIVSHGHADHFGGARRLQREYGAEVLMSAADWELALAPGGSEPRPVRDRLIRDGQVLEIGDVTFRFYLTPGHTPGTVSTIFDVRDGSTVHRAAIWGGTAMREELGFYQEYAESARRFQAAVREEGADVVLSNHAVFDDAHRKLESLATRPADGPHPFVIGPAATANYLTVVRDCAAAGLLRLPVRAP